jgi:lipoprotein-anchoring transpeptidase ErfK/SrfK
MPSSTSKLSRRTLFAGAGTAGALAAAVSVMPSVQSLAVSPVPVATVKPEKGGGYALSEHVKQYYKTALV